MVRKLDPVPGMAENPLSAGVESLYRELRGSASFILGIHEVLDQKLPDTAQRLWNDLGRISEQVLIDIEDQMGNILANIDSFSPAAASARISGLASSWENEVEQLSLITNKLSDLQIQLGDSNLNMILNEYLPSSIKGFGRIISFGKQIRPENL
jgi:hypothetical protein